VSKRDGTWLKYLLLRRAVLASSTATQSLDGSEITAVNLTLSLPTQPANQTFISTTTPRLDRHPPVRISPHPPTSILDPNICLHQHFSTHVLSLGKSRV
jgi:hypothetical protein